MQRRDFIRLTSATTLAAGAALVGPGCARPSTPPEAAAPTSTTALPSPPRSAMQTRPIDPVTGLSYAQALEVTAAQRLLFISGQVPADEQGHVPPDYPSQYRLAWKNVEKRLSSAGMTLDNLVKVTIYVSDRKYLKEGQGIRQEILGERYPALTIIITGIYDPAWLLEIEAIAAA